MKKLLPIQRAAEELGVTFPTVKLAIEHGQIKTVILGKRTLIPVAEITRILKSKEDNR